MRLRAYSSRLFDRPLSYGCESTSLYLGERLCKILAKVVLHCKIEDFRGKIKKIETDPIAAVTKWCENRK